MNILVLDVGTSSMRGILFSAEGTELLSKQCLYRADYMEEGWVEQDPLDWEEAMYVILHVISEAAEKQKLTIDAIAVTSQRSSLIPVDASMRPLCRAIMWQDKRAAGICKEFESENEKIVRLCGSRVNPVFSACKMTWIRKERPDLYKKIYKFLVVPDYLIYLLTGNLCTDYTYGSRSNLMNIRTCRWDDELLSLFEVEKEKLCPLVEPGTICGTVSLSAAEKTGCPQKIPVITAGGDQQCGAIGQGVVKEGILSVTAGTGGFLITAINAVPKTLSANVICNCSAIQNQYILESSVLTCSSAFDWFRRNFYEDETYEKLNQILEKTPVGANSVLCVPYFQGHAAPDWNSQAKASFSNITLHTEKSDLLRALIEGICYEIANGIDRMKEYVTIQNVLINGGLTNSEAFNQIQCDVCGMKLIRRGKTDATARGAFLAALVSLKVYKTVAEAWETVGKQGEAYHYLPNKEHTETYRRYRTEMNMLYERTSAETAALV